MGGSPPQPPVVRRKSECGPGGNGIEGPMRRKIGRMGGGGSKIVNGSEVRKN